MLPEVVTLCRRANADPRLVTAALAACPALAPIASFDGLAPADHQAFTELLNGARASEGSTLAFGRAVLASSVAARARRDAREMLAKLGNEALGVAQARDDRALEGRALRLLGAILLDAGQYEEAQVTLLGALDALDEGGDDVHRGIALEFLAMAKGRLGNFSEAIELLREAIELHRALGNRRLLLYEQSTLGALYAQSGELRRGRLATEEVVQLARAMGDRTAEAFARATLSYTCLGEGDTTRAKSEASRSAEMFRDAGQRSLAAYGVGVAAIARLVEGDIDGGVAMLDEATSAAKPADRALYGAYVATVEAKDDLFARARERVASARALLDTESPVIGAAVDVLAQAVDWLEHRGAPLVLPASQSVDLRVAILWLSTLGVPFTRPSRAPAAEAACLVRADGAAFSRGGVLVRLGAKPVLRKLTSALASARRETPGEPISVEALVALVWAGERMLERSARTRMHACIMRLRQLGLRGALVQSEGGYYLDPGETETVDELAG